MSGRIEKPQEGRYMSKSTNIQPRGRTGFLGLLRGATGTLGWLLCRHRRIDYLFTLYGDIINHYGGRRYVHRCLDCGRWVFRNERLVDKTVGGK